MAGRPINRRRFLTGASVMLAGPTIFAACSTTRADQGKVPPLNTTLVHFRLVEGQTGKTTPAMACISDANSHEVRLPPDGRLCTKPSNVQQFVSGVQFDPDPNWTGPVRKMQGKGDNDDRSYVYEERPSIPYWKEPVIYQTAGDFLIDLPAGRWRIAAGHGMEYVPVQEELEVTGHGATEKTLVLKRWIDLPARGWWSGDVHVHHPSYDPAQREFLVQYALAEDVHVVNLLEMGHHTGTEFSQAAFGNKFRVQRGNFALVSGQEDPRSTFGHIIGLNLQTMVRDTATYDFYDITFRGIHAQNDALVGFAHFAWNGCDLPRGFPWFVTTGEIDFIEHHIETSQWLMASVVCDNNAVAHTTPVYVVVNGQPTWASRQGPHIIEKQLAAIANLESEFAKSNDPRSLGIRERLGKAKVFYADLRGKMLR